MPVYILNGSVAQERNVALIKCEECGNDVSTKAVACPKCGAPVTASDPGEPSTAAPMVAPSVAAASGPWRWRRIRLVLGLVGFWLLAGGGAGLLARSDSASAQSSAAAFITAVLVVVLVAAVATDREARGMGRRFIWVIGLWLLHAGFNFSVALLLLFTTAGLSLAVDGSTLERAANLYAAFPFVIWAMRRSWFFVEPALDQL